MRDWDAGTPVVIRGIVHNRVWIAHSVTVVQDTADILVAYLTPGAPCKVSQELIDRKRGGTTNGGSRWDEQDSGDWRLVDWVWRQRRVLILLPADKYYAVFLFWPEETDEFEGWYVNFQLPYRKNERSVDTLDLELDLIVKPDGTYHWKDEAEYLEGIRRGFISTDEATRVEEAREEIMTLFAVGSPLFDRKWIDWQPDPGWKVPQLPTAWDIV